MVLPPYFLIIMKSEGLQIFYTSRFIFILLNIFFKYLLDGMMEVLKIAAKGEISRVCTINNKREG